MYTPPKTSLYMHVCIHVLVQMKISYIIFLMFIQYIHMYM